MNETQQPKSWWGNNRIWVLPVGGCLTLLIIGAIVLGGAIFSFVDVVQKSSGGDAALEKAQNNPNVIAVLGEPIVKDGFGSYNVNVNNGVKTSSATIPLKGPKSTGVLEVKATGKDDDLTYEVLKITVDDTGEVIDLRDEVEKEDF